MELKGTIASSHKMVISGIAHNFKENPLNFIEGHILIAEQTYPDMISFIKKAKAIVAETGGILSHAAIVSRELDIPCIVGVKDLIKNIHSGDKITLDLNKGVEKKRTNNTFS